MARQSSEPSTRRRRRRLACSRVPGRRLAANEELVATTQSRYAPSRDRSRGCSISLYPSPRMVTRNCGSLGFGSIFRRSFAIWMSTVLVSRREALAYPQTSASSSSRETGRSLCCLRYCRRSISRRVKRMGSGLCRPECQRDSWCRSAAAPQSTAAPLVAAVWWNGAAPLPPAVPARAR